MKYQVIRQGGCIGDDLNGVVSTGTKQECQEQAKRLRQVLSAGDRKYYHIKYCVKKTTK